MSADSEHRTQRRVESGQVRGGLAEQEVCPVPAGGDLLKFPSLQHDVDHSAALIPSSAIGE